MASKESLDSSKSPVISHSDPTENLKKKPAKGILKSSSSSSSFDAQEAATVRSVGKSHKETKFDEMNIIATLHPPDKDYGHMKIDEPKTPYERTAPDAADAVSPDDLIERLQQESDSPPAALRQSSSEEDSDEELTPEERAKKKAFQAKRKAHYDEFLMAKRALENFPEEDDDDEEAGESGGDGAGSLPPPAKTYRGKAK